MRFHVKPPLPKRSARVHARFGGRSPAACCCPPYRPAMLGAIATPCTQVTDPAALRTAGIPTFTLPGGSRCLPWGKRLVGRLSLARSTPRAYRRHADQEDDEREPASGSSLPVSRETGPSPRETAAIPPMPVRRRTLSLSDLPCFSNRQHSICPAQSGCICHVTRRQQYVVSHRARRIRREPLPAAGMRYQVVSRVRRPTTYLPPGRERPSRLIQQLGVTASALGDVGRVARSIAVGHFTIGFT